MTTIELDIRDVPADVQDILRDRAIREARPITHIIRDFAVENAKLINSAVIPMQEGGDQ